MSADVSRLDLRRKFDAIVREYRADLYRYAFWLCRRHQLADDVVQEALLRAWKAFGNLRDPSSAKQWMVSIVRREHARVYERKQLEMVDLANFEEEIPAAADNPDLDEMRKAIFGLEDGYREPLALQVLLGHSTREIAEIMELTEGTVLTRLHRARKKLKAAMNFDVDEPETRGDES